MRSKYLEMRQTYLKAVRRVKRSYQRSMQDKLEQELKCPKKFWKSMKRINVGNKKKVGCILQEVYDEDGNIKTGEEAVKVWREHFTKDLGKNKEGTVGDVQQNEQPEDIITVTLMGWTSVRDSVNLSLERRLHGLWKG